MVPERRKSGLDAEAEAAIVAGVRKVRGAPLDR